jgi:iron(III) transport system ATP-binding protein
VHIHRSHAEAGVALVGHQHEASGFGGDKVRAGDDGLGFHVFLAQVVAGAVGDGLRVVVVIVGDAFAEKRFRDIAAVLVDDGLDDVHARVQELLKLTRMEEFADRKPDQLSGGQAQRVALARALAKKPALVLLDEPFSALDAELREVLRAEVKAVLKAEGATAILVTHDQEEALSLADRVAVMRAGTIIQVGTPTEIYNAPADLGIATFLGDSVLIEGEVVGDKVHTALGKLTALNHIEPGQKGVVAVRSENFYLQPNPNGDSEVIGRAFFGHDAVVDVQTPSQKIRARSTGPFAPEVGMRVTVWVRGAVNFYPNSVRN